MADSPAGSAAFLSGQEIINDARTLSYLDAGFGPNGLNVSGGCSCPRIRELIECDGDPYVSPILDPAPWYDSSVPESGDFAGFLMTEFVGLGSTYTREVTDKITGGAVLGRLRPKPRTLTWKGYLFGRTDCAVRYGLSWLTANLKGQGCFCGGEDLDLLVCCPELSTDPVDLGCNAVSIKKPLNCPPFSEPDAFRTLKNVGLIDGPTILSQRRTGCKANCGNSTCGGDSLIMEVEFSLMAGNPYMYGCPVCLCADQNFPSAEEIDCSIDQLWVKVFDGETPNLTFRLTTTPATPTGGTYTLTFDGATTGPIAFNASGGTIVTALEALPTIDPGDVTTRGGSLAGGGMSITFQGTFAGQTISSSRLTGNGAGLTGPGSPYTINVLPLICGTESCPDPVDCSDDEDACPTVVLPNIPDFVDGCFCDALAPVQKCCDIPASSFGQFFEGAPVIEIFSGSGVMRATTIRFFDNPQGLVCCDLADDACRNCDSLQVRYIPANSLLTIDGTTRQVTLQCPGMGAPILADHLTVTPFAWPILQCIDFCICIETEGATVADDATVSVLVVPREMG